MGVITSPCPFLTCKGGQLSRQATLPHECGLSPSGARNKITSQGDQVLETRYSHCYCPTNFCLFLFNFQHIIFHIYCSNFFHFLLLLDTALKLNISLSLFYRYGKLFSYQLISSLHVPSISL